MKVFYTPKATQSIVKFFDFYKELYLRLYDDTGLGPAEDYIKDQYSESSIVMRDGVYSEIEKLLSQDTIFGYVPGNIGSDIRMVTQSYGSYRLFVEYREIENTRIIENVRIYRK